jgi:methyltransferase (TIGR00027 family)
MHLTLLIAFLPLSGATCCNRFFDDFAIDATTFRHDHHHQPIRQVVLLGSGLDTRAYRLPWPKGVTVYEVDFQEVFDEKQQVLHSAKLSCDSLKYVTADLRDGTWEQALIEAGFQTTYCITVILHWHTSLCDPYI